ncbi:hypothetical protein D3C79_1096090 [compost metagenome]
MVCAKIRLAEAFASRTAERSFARLVKKHCMAHLQTYKVPVRISLTNEKLHSERFKKKRRLPDYE